MTSPLKVSFNHPGGQSVQIGNYQSNYQAPVPPTNYYRSTYETVQQQPNTILTSVVQPVNVQERRTTQLVSRDQYQPAQPANVVIERNTVVEDPARQYERTLAAKRLGPDTDPAEKSSCCSPICWTIGILLGLAALTLALLYGLGVIGGPIPAPNSGNVTTTAVSTPTPSSTTNSTTTTSTTTTTTATSTTPTATGTTSVSPTSTVTVQPNSVPATTTTTTTH